MGFPVEKLGTSLPTWEVLYNIEYYYKNSIISLYQLDGFIRKKDKKMLKNEDYVLNNIYICFSYFLYWSLYYYNFGWYVKDSYDTKKKKLHS